jgi:guanyl-specific ribonuclease Sa
MPRLHARRYRQFLKLVKAGAIATSPASRRKQPRARVAAGQAARADDLPEESDNTLPLIPGA